MAILRHIKIIALLLQITCFSGCAATIECSTLSNRISIYDWSAPLPQHGVLYRYKKGSNFSVLEQMNESDFVVDKIWQKENTLPNLEIKFVKNDTYPVDADYKLILDKNIEYRISNIVHGKVNHGCQLPSGNVNQCKLFMSSHFAFDMNCGVPVK